MSERPPSFQNALIHESSPYLLQHAHNPVNWFAWKPEVLQKAKDENKLILISIGYSACHWCHVMEHECFEDEETAILMNRHFINIKVDREERPDIDQVYMHAVQLITGRGGWPLNCIALPDGRPVYGGTYFPREQWKSILIQVAGFFNKDRTKCYEYAGEITDAIHKNLSPEQHSSSAILTRENADRLVANWKTHFDLQQGGPARVPKFPLPNNFEFLLRYAYHTSNRECLDYTILTLNKMAFGGIYDQLGGGFARYSVDGTWKVPHFEKMLYDNAQLISIYSQAWQHTKSELYRKTVYETIGFLEREMHAPGSGFYSAIDADSDGVEGKYYVWKREEIENYLGRDAALFMDYFNINQAGLWEHDNYILIRKKSDEEVFHSHSISMEAGQKKIADSVKILLEERSKRNRPALDDKILVSWNALLIKAYIDAFHAFGQKEFLEKAEALALFILTTCKQRNGHLFHVYKNEIPSVNGFLEDYGLMMEALISLYSATGNEYFLREAKNLAVIAFDFFYNPESGYFYFNSSQDPPLFSRSTELEDNVVPSSNSSIAKALFRLGHFFPEAGYRDVAIRMLEGVMKNAVAYGSSYSNWASLLLDYTFPFYEVVITGPGSLNHAHQLAHAYKPNKLIAASSLNSDLPVFINRFQNDRLTFYICEDQVCQAPVYDFSQAMSLLLPQ